MSVNPEETVEETFTTIGRRTSSGQLEFWDGDCFDTEIDCCEDYSSLSPSRMIDVLLEVCEEAECSHNDVTIMTVERVIRLKSEVVIDDVRLFEARRAKALAKLNADDIAILGIGNIATYSKIKFHNAPEEEL